MINHSIKNQLLILTLSNMAIMLAILLTSVYLFSLFEHAQQNQAAANRIEKLIQQARISEKAYRQYYRKDYRDVVVLKMGEARQLLQKITGAEHTKGPSSVLEFISSYEKTFDEMIATHDRNVRLSQELRLRMDAVQANTFNFMDIINVGQFNARTIDDGELDEMESGLLSPLQDVNYLSIFLQLSHQRFLRTNNPQHLAAFYTYMNEYSPGLFGALKQGAAYLGNRIYQESATKIETHLKSAVTLLEASRELLSYEERKAAQLDKIGEGLETQTDMMLQLATNSSRSAKTTAFSVAAMLFILGTALIAGISFTITRSITEPLGNMVDAANAISRGNLSIKIIDTKHAEFAKLGTAFNNMIANLRRLLALLESEIAERKAAQIELKKLSRRMILNQEKERAAVARELHDELGQVMTALKIDAVWIKRNATFGTMRGIERVDQMIDFIEKSLDDVKSLSLRLRPKVLDDMGLSVALQWLGIDFYKRTGIVCNVFAQDFKVNNDVLSTTLYRVAQECLTNVTRHAQASWVKMFLSISEDNDLRLVIEDNGRGFDPAPIREQEALGIAGMMERAELIGALFEIVSLPGQGCTVNLTIKSSNWERGES